MYVSHLTCLQELHACQLLVLVSTVCLTKKNKLSLLFLFYFYCACLCICQQKLFVILRYVIVECEDQDTQQRDPKTHEMYLNVMRRFSQALLKVCSGIRLNTSETNCLCLSLWPTSSYLKHTLFPSRVIRV